MSAPMTPKMELPEEMRTALASVGNTWGPWSHLDWGSMGRLQKAGLVEILGTVLPEKIRRTPAGRAALGEGE